MKCPRCEAINKTSTLKLVGPTRQAGNVDTYYDAQGTLHEHENKCASDWECSNGHKLTKHTHLGCGGCLDPNKETWV